MVSTITLISNDTNKNNRQHSEPENQHYYYLESEETCWFILNNCLKIKSDLSRLYVFTRIVHALFLGCNILLSVLYP